MGASRSHSLVPLTSVLLFLGSCGGPPVVAGELAGEWRGFIEFGGQRLLMVFRIVESADGVRTVALDSPDQGAFGIPASLTADAGRVEIDVPSAAGRFAGTLDAISGRISGKWRQGGLELDLVLERAEPDSLAGPRRPQEPAPPFPYRTTDVSFANHTDRITLTGTITIPNHAAADTAVAGIVLLSGSGQRPRDQELYGHRSFLVLADALTRAGFAVLRFDDRGAGQSGGRETLADVTSEDLARDAEAAIAFLSAQPGVRADRVGFIGHSEGAFLAAAVAARSNLPAFVVLLGGHAMPGHELMMLQSAAILRAGGAPEAYIETVGAANRKVYDLAMAATDLARTRAEIRDVMAGLGMNEQQIDAQLGAILSPWYRYFLAHDPRDELRQIRVPVLALIGELDRQVPPAENLTAAREALASAPTTDVTVRELPGVNHLFQTATTGGLEEYAAIEETFSPAAIDEIARWIADRAR